MSKQPFQAMNYSDENGKPAGGFAKGTGFNINWQNGPLGVCTCSVLLATGASGLVTGTQHVPGCERQEPNGAFVETIIAAVIQRIEYYQTSEFACRENALALTKLQEGLHWLEHRTAERVARGVEGSHEK